MKLKQVPLDQLNALNPGTLMEALGIQYLEIGDQFVKASMPVNERTRQPMGLLHGGASAALMETVGSLGSVLLIDPLMQNAVGLDISANHVGAVKEGEVHATARLIHAGRTTHLWSIEVREASSQRLICHGKHTVMILPKAE
ncbi:MAG: PaaI family thioesterase [Sphingomonadales bacterium]